MVKANAYGHGAEEVAQALAGAADCFAVAILDEALQLRTAACGKDVLVFTPPLDGEEAYQMAANGFVATVPDLRTARLLSETCAKYRLPIKAHLKVNTGMNRYGTNASTLGRICSFLRDDPFVRVEGVYSHLYGSDSETAKKQRELFVKALGVCRRYFPDVLAHLSATYGALLGEDFAFGMVRVGIGLYGYLPFGKPTAETLKRTGVPMKTVRALKLKKAMRVFATVVTVRKFSFGGAGYGRMFADEERRRIGRLSVCRYGYADGILRRKDNGAAGWRKNVNNLCMDVRIREGGGKRGGLTPVLTDADETAKVSGTISYEVLCAATRRAEFVYDR